MKRIKLIFIAVLLSLCSFAGCSVKEEFDSFQCGTIIDFSMTHYDYGTPYKQYIEKRDKQVANGAKHYTALQCCKQENGARQTHSLAKDTTLMIKNHDLPKCGLKVNCSNNNTPLFETEWYLKDRAKKEGK